jgi:hypothetical protein
MYVPWPSLCSADNAKFTQSKHHLRIGLLSHFPVPTLGYTCQNVAMLLALSRLSWMTHFPLPGESVPRATAAAAVGREENRTSTCPASAKIQTESTRQPRLGLWAILGCSRNSPTQVPRESHDNCGAPGHLSLFPSTCRVSFPTDASGPCLHSQRSFPQAL